MGGVCCCFYRGEYVPINQPLLDMDGGGAAGGAVGGEAKPTGPMKLVLSSHPGQAVCLLERVDFMGHGHWLGLGPVEEAATIVRPDAGGGSLLLFDAEEQGLGLHISEGPHNTREGNTLLFGTWDHPPFVFNADGTISPKAKKSLVLGFAPCPFQHHGGRELVVFVKKGAEQQLVFEHMHSEPKEPEDVPPCAEEQRVMSLIAGLEARLGPLQERIDAADAAAEFAVLEADIEGLLADVASEMTAAGIQPLASVPLTLSSHPGMAVKLLERVDFMGHGHFLAIGPADGEDAASAVGRKAASGAVVLASDRALGLHIAELDKKLGEGNAVLFGTWGNHSMKLQDDGSLSPVQLPEMVLGFAPCPHHDKNGQELVVLVAQGSEHTLRFDRLGFTPSTVSAVGRKRLISVSPATVCVSHLTTRSSERLLRTGKAGCGGQRFRAAAAGGGGRAGQCPEPLRAAALAAAGRAACPARRGARGARPLLLLRAQILRVGGAGRLNRSSQADAGQPPG